MTGQTTLTADSATLSADHSPRVRHLLAAARRAFIVHGFAGVSIDALARDAGVSKETIYRHFADKEALFRAALEEMGSEFVSRAEALHRAAPPAGEELTALARAVLDSAVEGGLLSPLRVAAGVAGVMPDFAAELQTMQWRRMESVRQALEDHVSDERAADERTSGDVIRNDQARTLSTVPLELALDFGSLAVGGSALLMGFPDPSPAERARLADHVAALFGEGVLHAVALKTAGWDDPDLAASEPPAAPQPPHLRALLDVAAQHFLTHGFEGASLLEIGTEAKVGRGTLYRHFANKTGLFAATLRDLAAQVADDAAPPALPPLTAGVPAVEEALAAFAAAAMAALASPRSIALHRAAISVATRDPALARQVHDTVREPWVAPLAAWLEGELRLAAPRWLAREFLVLALQGNRLFSTGRTIPPAEVPVRAKRVAQVFLHGFRAAL